MIENSETPPNEPQKVLLPSVRQFDPMVLFFLVVCVTSSALLVYFPQKIGLWLLLVVSAGLVFRSMALVASRSFWRWLILPLIVLIPVITWSSQAIHRHWNLNQDKSLISRLVTREELILTLDHGLDELAEGLFNLNLPAPNSTARFDETVMVTDLEGQPTASAFGLEHMGISNATWNPLTTSQRVAAKDLEIWRPLIDRIAYFESIDLHLGAGEFLSKAMDRFQGNVLFSAAARLKSGDYAQITGTIQLDWRRRPSGQRLESLPSWRISDWRTGKLNITTSARQLFVESLDHALPNPEQRRQVRESQHELAAIAYFESGATNAPHPFFSPITVNQKPGLSVVDVDRDGFDDLYVTVPMGRNQLLRNRGDGTFEESSRAFGLHVPGETSCAIFADFDNDGDTDAIIGRNNQRSLYLENMEGKWEPKPVGVDLPFLTVSMAAADYNNDGLLDVYMSTCRPSVVAASGMSGGDLREMNKWPDEYLEFDTALEYYRRFFAAKSKYGGMFPNFLDQIGPPNLLLINRGQGKFEIAPESESLELWRNSMQATWSDFDDDGDPDLYVANDWAPDHLFRNDGTKGFTDITQEAGLDHIGCSKGASWGDYDNDGAMDLFTSNISSAAGRRILDFFERLNPRLAETARGNFLFRQSQDHHFSLQSPLPSLEQTATETGWSWGAQFADFDNDGYQDLYVPAGYFTAPSSVSTEFDLENDLWRTAVRGDENSNDDSFRFSEGWLWNALLGGKDPEIENRLLGERDENGRLRVPSLAGNQRNRFFFNVPNQEEKFRDVSALSGLDAISDSRAFVVWDYDRDGYQDVALVNANEPLLSLYHNEMSQVVGTEDGEPVGSGKMIALRFVGGNSTASASALSNRDGFGAMVTASLDNLTIKREHRCGEGFGIQNSAIMMIGIGQRAAAKSISVRWPSGIQISTTNVVAGSLLTVYEGSSDSPTGESFVIERYARSVNSTDVTTIPSPPKITFPLNELAPSQSAKLHVYTTMATTSPACMEKIPHLNLLVSILSPEGVTFTGLPIDVEDDVIKLDQFKSTWNPSYNLLTDLPSSRRQLLEMFLKQMTETERPALPTTVITDASGKVVLLGSGLPTVSMIRKLMMDLP